MEKIKTDNLRLAKVKYFDTKHNGAEISDIEAYAFLVEVGENQYLNVFDPDENIAVFDRSNYSNYTKDDVAFGNRLVHVCGAVIKDRKIMANDGILVVIINVDMKKRELLIKPNITTRGFILVNENEELIHKIENKAEQVITTALTNPKSTFATLKSDITETLYPFINNLTGRKPIILPIILDIKRENKQTTN